MSAVLKFIMGKQFVKHNLRQILASFQLFYFGNCIGRSEAGGLLLSNLTLEQLTKLFFSFAKFVVVSLVNTHK